MYIFVELCINTLWFSFPYFRGMLAYWVLRVNAKAPLMWRTLTCLYFREFHSYVHLCQIMHKNIIVLYYILLKKKEKKREKNNVISSSIHQIIHHLLLPIISCHPSEKLEEIFLKKNKKKPHGYFWCKKQTNNIIQSITYHFSFHILLSLYRPSQYELDTTRLFETIYTRFDFLHALCFGIRLKWYRLF